MAWSAPMSITILISNALAPLLLMLSPLSVVSVALVRDCPEWRPDAKARKAAAGSARATADPSCDQPPFILM